jgi:hypothetical protein
LNNTKALKGIIEPGIDFAIPFHVVDQSPPGRSEEALLAIHSRSFEQGILAFPRKGRAKDASQTTP